MFGTWAGAPTQLVVNEKLNKMCTLTIRLLWIGYTKKHTFFLILHRLTIKPPLFTASFSNIFPLPVEVLLCSLKCWLFVLLPEVWDFSVIKISFHLLLCMICHSVLPQAPCQCYKRPPVPPIIPPPTSPPDSIYICCLSTYFFSFWFLCYHPFFLVYSGGLHYTYIHSSI